MAECAKCFATVLVSDGAEFDEDDLCYSCLYEENMKNLAALAVQQEEIDGLKAQWEEHTKHVGRFLTEMYQTMIDPLDEPEPSLKIAELCEMLLNQAREDREKLNRSPFNWPADWNKDSSLETWFPLTAEELTRVKAENAKLQARLDARAKTEATG